MALTKLSLLVCLCTQLIVVRSKVTYSHHLVLYECDPNNTIYRFQYANEPKLEVKDTSHDVFKIHTVKSVNSKSHYEVTINKSNLKSSHFWFNITLDVLVVEIDGEMRKCEQNSSDSKCTVLVSVLASISLLLFGALALSLIVLKQKKVPCIDKIAHWWRTRSESKKNQSANPGLDLDNLRRIHENGLKQEYTPEPDIDDSPPIIPKNIPRKSSLKPPRMDSFPIPQVTESSISIDPSTVRRKSIVTFNERTEIRS